MVYKSKGKLLTAVLEWIHEESGAGKRVDCYDIAQQFGIDASEAEDVLRELRIRGELH
jgi:ribosomal protein S25